MRVPQVGRAARFAATLARQLALRVRATGGAGIQSTHKSQALAPARNRSAAATGICERNDLTGRRQPPHPRHMWSFLCPAPYGRVAQRTIGSKSEERGTMETGVPRRGAETARTGRSRKARTARRSSASHQPGSEPRTPPHEHSRTLRSFWAGRAALLWSQRTSHRDWAWQEPRPTAAETPGKVQGGRVLPQLSLTLNSPNGPRTLNRKLDL